LIDGFAGIGAAGVPNGMAKVIPVMLSLSQTPKELETVRKMDLVPALVQLTKTVEEDGLGGNANTPPVNDQLKVAGKQPAPALNATYV